MGRLNPRETFMLFAAMVGFSLIMFAGGIYVGKTYYVEAQPVAAEGIDSPPAEDVKAQLGFYDELLDDSRSKAQPATTAETARPPGAGQQQSEQAPPSGAQPEPTESSSPAIAKIEVGYTVQVGAVNSRQDADKVIEKLQQSGYSGMVAEPEEGGDRLFRVWVGQFATRPEAVKLEERLKADQFPTYVKRVRFP